MTDILIAPPSLEPVTLAEAKSNMRVTWSDDDAKITDWIGEAREQIEELCDLALVLQSRRLLLDRFPSEIEMFRKPLRAVQSIQYLDVDGVLQTLATSQYRVDKASHPARITQEYNVTWPGTHPVMHAVRVNYTAGILLPFTADAGTDVVTAAGHGYADADIVQVSTLGGVLPTGLAAATNYHVRDATADALKLAAAAGGAAIDITGAGTPPNVLGTVPRRARSLILLLVAHRHENREPVNIGSSVNEIPMAAQHLFDQLRATWRA